jgi:predicted membrane channel-forming protein YqfA (hemolysin III family)
MTDVDVSSVLPTTPRAVRLRILAAALMWVVGLLSIIRNYIVDMDLLTDRMDKLPFFYFLMPSPLAGIGLAFFAFLALQRKALDLAKGLSAFLGGLWLVYGTYLMAAHKPNPVSIGLAWAGCSLMAGYLMLRRACIMDAATRAEERPELHIPAKEEPDFEATHELAVPDDGIDLDIE